METIFVATTFLLLGLILGAIAMGIFIHKYYLKPDEEYDERPQGPLNMIPIPIDLSKIFGNQKRAVDSEEVSMKKIASLFEQKIEECKRNENWEKLTELTEHYNTIEN